jgi:hypothetical protein
MIKWIGQHIWDFVSRFRNDVYLEDISTDTIASGGNLGLDSNNKIVKAAVVANTDTKIWQCIIPGYTASINNTLYYNRTTTTFLNWSAADSNPASGVSDTQFTVPFFIANEGAGSITNIRVQGTSDSADPFSLYFYKAADSDGDTSVSLTFMFSTLAITPTVNETYSFSSSPSGSNTFSADDRLYVFWKKNSNSGASNNYYTISVSGEYT